MAFTFRDEKYIWTQHARIKARFYRLAESRIKRIIRHPARIEEGILEGAVAAMQVAETKRYSEIWVMYVMIGEGGSLGDMHSRHAPSAPAAELAKGRQDFPPSEEPSKSCLPLSRTHITSTAPMLTGGFRKLKIITAWRYPGKSPKRDPIPLEILKEIRNIVY